MILTKLEKENLAVKESRNGKGLFVKKPFQKGKRILKVTGKLMTCGVRDKIDEETRSNTYRYDENLYLSPKGRVGNFINHSCNPNAKVEKVGRDLFIVAIKNITKGKEIFFDYSTLVAPDDIWQMKCNCGSTKCRHMIGQFKSLPKEIKKKYLSLGMVSRHILKS
jgi:SET domain-containing protein